MKTNPASECEANLERLEKLLADIRSSLSDLVPSDSFADSDSKKADEGPVRHSHGGLLGLFKHSS